MAGETLVVVEVVLPPISVLGGVLPLVVKQLPSDHATPERVHWNGVPPTIAVAV